MKATEDFDQPTKELKALSREIFLLKKRYKRLEEDTFKEELRNEVRSKQFQALFYIEKLQNLYKQREDVDAERDSYYTRQATSDNCLLCKKRVVHHSQFNNLKL